MVYVSPHVHQNSIIFRFLRGAPVATADTKPRPGDKPVNPYRRAAEEEKQCRADPDGNMIECINSHILSGAVVPAKP